MFQDSMIEGCEYGEIREAQLYNRKAAMNKREKIDFEVGCRIISGCVCACVHACVPQANV